MDDPVKELPEVIRKITEPYAASEIVANVDKYFTHDAYILYPLFNQLHTKDGKQDLKGVYKILRVFSINNRITFHAIMFSEDRLFATADLTESLDARFLPISLKLRFISRVDLRKESDGKYRICRQEDNYPNDLKRAGLYIFPVLPAIFGLYKIFAGLIVVTVGRFFLRNNLFGP